MENDELRTKTAEETMLIPENDPVLTRTEATVLMAEDDPAHEPKKVMLGSFLFALIYTFCVYIGCY